MIAQPGISDTSFAALIRSQPRDVMLLALEQVTTYAGALRIYRAEANGLRRWNVLLTAARRLEQLGGTERPGVRTSLIAAGVALEPGQV
jgi:hypothetical protein